ncbi:MAG: bifunctional riboflavin kinase/FAD synthetase [Sphingomicrobium sp.]
MKRLFHDQPIPEELRGAIIALGNFDGFHLGHQAVVGRAVQRGAHERRPVIVATFDPHPVRHFKPDTPPFRLTTLDQREELFAHAGADAMMVFKFGAELASTTAEDFISGLLAKRFGAAGVVTGEDFIFGKGRGGNIGVLREIGANYGIGAETVAPVLLGGQRISSGRIRDALRAGDPHAATQQLTRPFAIRAEVIHGDKRGADFGWPTANMKLGPYLRPAYGVYAVRVRLPDQSEYDGVANLGHRPMFEPEELLEAHLFDFSGDLYGQHLEVALHHYLRPEAKFDTIDELVAQIGRDAAQTKELLA